MGNDDNYCGRDRTGRLVRKIVILITKGGYNPLILIKN